MHDSHFTLSSENLPPSLNQSPTQPELLYAPKPNTIHKKTPQSSAKGAEQCPIFSTKPPFHSPRSFRNTPPAVMHACHTVFHVSMLSKCLHKDDELLAKIPEYLQPNMTLAARPVKVLGRRLKELRKKKIPLMIVLWDCDSVDEQTWEPEERMKARFKKWYEKQVES